MNIKDEMHVTGKSVQGIFSYKCYDRSNNLVDSVTEKNVILANAAGIMRDLMAFSTNARITYLGFGNLNRSNSDTSAPPEASAMDTGLVNELGRVSVSTSTLIVGVNPAILFSAVLDYDQLNGDSYNMISEFSLLTALGLAFNKKNRAPIIKNSSYRYEFEWTIVFV